MIFFSLSTFFTKEAMLTFVEYSPVVSTFIAAVVLIFTYRGIKEDIKTRQIQLLESGFKSINGAELLFYTKYKTANHNTRKEWDSIFFNSIEFYSFLINKKYIDKKDAIGFFGGAVVSWYENIFLRYASRQDVKNSNIYPEMKALYTKVKSVTR